MPTDPVPDPGDDPAENPIPMPVLRMIRHPDSNKVLTTLGADGYPHSIAVAALMVDRLGRIYVGEVYMHRTRQNLERCPHAEILVWMGKSGYSIKVDAARRFDEGRSVELINELLGRTGMTAHAVWRFEPNQVWDESASRTSGDRLRWTSSARGGSPVCCSTSRRSAPASASPWR